MNMEAADLNSSNLFDASLKDSKLFPLKAESVSVLQVNMGRLCNQACRHCHVDAGPARTEVMGRGVMEKCLEALASMPGPVVDITGGAPEMNPHYRWFVRRCVEAGYRVKTRTNLTILVEKGYEYLPEFFAGNKVEVIASLPYFLPETVDKQRGRGAFEASIEALKRLNAAGYGVESGLVLNLVFNPCGAFFPPYQKSIESDFRKELEKRYAVRFSNLFTITNMPIGRFLKFLDDTGNLKRYLERLRLSYNPAAAENVMCKYTVSVDWTGVLYDCDFNQMLGLKCGYGAPDHIDNFDLKRLSSRRVATGPHCYGCTAGAGSSCSGAVA